MKRLVSLIVALISCIITVNAVDMSHLPHGFFKVSGPLYLFYKGATLSDFINHPEEVAKNAEGIIVKDTDAITIKDDGFVVVMLSKLLTTTQLETCQKEVDNKLGYIYNANKSISIKSIKVKNTYVIFIEYDEGVISFYLDT